MIQLLHLSLLLSFACAFVQVPTQRRLALDVAMSSSLDGLTQGKTYRPVFDFTDKQKKAIDSFERIDDAVMGGISTSSMREVKDASYVSWGGVCRLDGGGFCGVRTLPFEQPLQVDEADGFYLKCRLASDDEPERRIWKITTRTEQSRGEQLYQAAFELPKSKDGEEFVTIQVPFSDFTLVRGPRMVPDSAPMNVTGGLYQIGLSLSKFVISSNVTELDNFRPGFFDLNIQEIGVYQDEAESKLDVMQPQTLTKEEAEKKRPLLVKALLPVAKIFFSEEKQRRKSAMRILRKRGLSRGQAILFGVKVRAQKYGLIRSFGQALSMVSMDVFRTVVGTCLRVGLFYPLAFLRKAVLGIGKLLSSKKKGEPTQ